MTGLELGSRRAAVAIEMIDVVDATRKLPSAGVERVARIVMAAGSPAFHWRREGES